MSTHNEQPLDLVKLVENILFAPNLIEHIHGGAARELYPQHVADAAEQLVQERANAIRNMEVK